MRSFDASKGKPKIELTLVEEKVLRKPTTSGVVLLSVFLERTLLTCTCPSLRARTYGMHWRASLGSQT
jgi:hypothetical protein